MTYQFLNNSIDINDIVLPNSDKIHPLLLKNDDADIKKALAFLATFFPCLLTTLEFLAKV